MTPDEQDKRDAIRKARIAKQARPWITGWYEFERNQTIAKFRTDAEIVANPIKAIEYQQYLSAIERVAMQCLKDEKAAEVEEE